MQQERCRLKVRVTVTVTVTEVVGVILAPPLPPAASINHSLPPRLGRELSACLRRIAAPLRRLRLLGQKIVITKGLTAGPLG